MKKAILVLGPPRSGTSVISHVVHELGVDFGSHDRFVDPGVHVFNPIFFELQSLNDLNDEIFGYFSVRYTDFNWMPREGDFDEAVILAFEKKISDFFLKEFSGSQTVGLKDPRFCFTLPLWDVVLRRQGFDVNYIVARRSSRSVFVSNKIENKYASPINFRLVAQSALLARQFVDGKAHVVVQYEKLLADPVCTIRHMCDGLGLDPVRSERARAVIRADLNHQKMRNETPLYSYFDKIIDADVLLPDEQIRYREIFNAATFDGDLKIARLAQILEKRDEQIVGFSQDLLQKTNQIVSLDVALGERDGLIVDLERRQADQGEQLSTMAQALSDRDEQLAEFAQSLGEKTRLVIMLDEELLGRKELVLDLTARLNEQNAQRAALSQILSERDGALLDLRRLVQEYQDSTCWLLTKPVRSIGLRIRRLFAFFSRGETEAARNIALSTLRVHVDRPCSIFNVVDGALVISGWAVDLNAASAVRARVRIGKVVYEAHSKQREDVQLAFATICTLPLDVGFAVVPSLSMGLHRLRIDVLGADDCWITVRRAFLFRMPRILMGGQRRNMSYTEWVRVEQRQLKAELPDINRHIEVMVHKPNFVIVLDVRSGLAGWAESLHSIRNQIYPHYEVCALVNAKDKAPPALLQIARSTQDALFTELSGDFMIFLEAGQRLATNALYEFANAVNLDPEVDLIYGDEDTCSASGKRSNPFHKPAWSPDYLESFNYIGFPACFRRNVASACRDYGCIYDMVLQFTERTTRIQHVGKVLGHGSQQVHDDARLERTSVNNVVALQRRLSRTGRNGMVREHELHRGCYDIKLELSGVPLVSIIIPTAGKTVYVDGHGVDLIVNIIEQITSRSTYKNIEIIVVDNGDLSGRQQQTLTEKGCKKITFSDPGFNISKKLNLGASIASGELFLLMNDDIEILTPDWIERMIEHFEKPHVGVVGAKLLYPDGRTQHVGVVHNSGNPDHVRRLFPSNEAGYYFSTYGVRNYMAVTGAVMMTTSELYRAVGGYSEELAVSYNDADFCLKVRETGRWIVYAPKVELTHMESQSRVASADMGEVAWYHKRWAAHTVSDPYYNERFLTVASPTFEPCVNRRVL